MKISEDLIPRVTRPYDSWSDKTLAAETVIINTAMTDNPGFTNPDPSLVDFNEAIMAFIAQLGKAGTRDSVAVALKNTRRKELINITIRLGNYVSQVAENDLDLLVSSGFPMRRSPKPAILETPKNFRVTNGLNPGELVLKVDGMKAARSFNFELTQDPMTPASSWLKTSSSRSKCTISGLEGGKRYWLRIYVIGSKNQVAWGDTIQSPFVQ